MALSSHHEHHKLLMLFALGSYIGYSQTHKQGRFGSLELSYYIAKILLFVKTSSTGNKNGFKI